MKLILDFDYNRLPLDDEPRRHEIINPDHIPGVGDTLRWDLKDGELYYAVVQRSFAYENGTLKEVTCHLEEA